MTCRECERVLLNGKRCTGDSRETVYLAHQHQASCPRCRQALSGLPNVNAALTLLRSATERYEASGEVERNLLAIYREHIESLPRGIQQRWRFSRWAVAAVLVVAGLAGYFGMRTKSPFSVKPNMTAVSGGVTLNSRPPALNRLAKRRQRPKRPATTRRDMVTIAKASPANQENSSRTTAIENEPKREEVAADSAVPTAEGGTVMRVTLPASSLQMIGLPVAPDAANRRVTADITIDPYGVVQRMDLVGPRPAQK